MLLLRKAYAKAKLSRLRKLVKPSVTDRIIFINRYLLPGATRGYKVLVYKKWRFSGDYLPPRQGSPCTPIPE
jgi:hypothetical protein